MSVDMSHALRHGECLANPIRMQATRWAGLKIRFAAEHQAQLTPRGI